MKMSIKVRWKDYLRTVLVLWWLLILFDGFYCIKVGFWPTQFIPGLLHGYTKQINLTAIAVIYCIIFANEVIRAASKSIFKIDIQAFYIFLIFDILATFLYYTGEFSLSMMFWYDSVYLCLISYFMFVEYISNPQKAQVLLLFLLLFALIMGILVLFATYKCNTSGVVILPYSNMNPYHLRNDAVRFTAPSVDMVLGFTVSLGTVFSEHHKKIKVMRTLSLVTMLITFAVTIYAIQTRALIAGFLIMFGMVWMFSGSERKRRKRLFVGVLLAGLALYLAGDYIVEALQTSLSIDLSERSVTAREGAYIYYLKAIVINPLIGLGRIYDASEIGMKLRHGPMGNFYPDDVGIVGGMAVFGAWIVVWYATLFRKILSEDLRKGMICSVAMLFLVTLPTYFLFGEVVVVIVPFLLSMVDCERKYEDCS